MRCKQGDLATIVRSWAGNEGKVVTCLRLATRDELPPDWAPAHIWGPTWRVDRELPSKRGHLLPFVCDVQLRPLRDNDGEDETLTWAGKPNDIKEPA